MGFFLLAHNIIHDIVMRFKVFTAVRIKNTFFCDVMPWNCQVITPHKVMFVYNYEVLSVKLMYHPTHAFTLMWCRFTPGRYSSALLQYGNSKIQLSLKCKNFIEYFSSYVHSSKYRGRS